ncbi:DNA ligase, partial [Candidatus Daviesbacteria bacterium]|nr:DNA ligase [Candidatus Daviesbacteria bacterium]
MTFGKLAEYFEKLEGTSSRLALIDILCDLFSQVKKEEIAQVCYLLQGRVAPFYEPIELGMSEKLVAAALARAYSAPREDVLKLYGKLGDMGFVAEKLSDYRLPTTAEDGRRKTVSNLSIKEVFETLVQIAKTQGEGTVEKKVSALAEMLKKVDPISAKHLVRVPLGVSRLGIGDPTILDSFAKLKLGDRSKRKLLEGAYNRVSDLGLIGETLWEGGLKAVEKLQVTVGRPIRSELCERLPTAEKVIEKMSQVNAQRKLDGFRVQIHKDKENIRLFSRNLEETTPMFPEIVASAQKQIKAKTAILDCEAIGFNPTSEEFLPFQETTTRRRKYGIEELAKKIPLKAFCFDIL